MEIFDIAKLLRENSYPGRGIVVGRSADDKYAVIAYFIMGRSENSRNRIFTETEDGIRTEAFDPSKMVDPSLIIYHPVRVYEGATIVTNGDQTDTVRDGLAAGKSYIEALRTRQFEPDGPNYTPRISAVVEPDGAYEMSILKSFDGDPACNKRFFFEYDAPRAGIGHFLHTYMTDGSPLPSFEGEPETVRIQGDLEQFTETIWTNLNEDNKVSLYTSFINLETGEARTLICNKHVK
ncbi:MAG: IMP cyclohydrolase [Eubacteriales bacterium]|nr:IMP cyclohydrolase [Eubacteriales bacterium]